MRNFVLNNFPFLENDFDAMTDYELFCKMVEYMRNAVNQLSAYDKKFVEFNQRLTEIENYIATLDIQDEVDKKLDEMYENGQLATLITQFLSLSALYIFNDIDEMIAGTNFVDGSIAKTLHFANDDNGGAFYRIRTVTNEDVIDNITLFAITELPTLVAELIPQYEMNTSQFGCVSEEDNTANFSKIIGYINDDIIKELYISDGIYTISSKFAIDGISSFKIKGFGTIDNGCEETACLEIKNSNNFVLQDFNITSSYQYENPTTTSNALGCVCVHTCYNFEITNIKVNEVNGGIFIVNCHDGDIHDNNINDCKSWGLMIGEYGLRNFYDNYNLLVHSNICTNGYDGIKMTGYIKNISIYDNICANNSRDGIDYAGHSADNIKIYNNTLVSNEVNGIEFKQLIRSTYTPDPLKTLVFKNIEISNNKITEHKRAGLNLEVYYNDNSNVNNVVINGNIIKNDNTYDGNDKGIQIYPFNTSNYNALTIINNIVEGLHYDIHLTNVNNTVVKNNIFKYCLSVPVRIEYSEDFYNIYGIPFDNLLIIDNEIRQNINSQLINGNTAGRTNITNIVIEHNLMEFDKSNQYPIDNNYIDAGNTISLNNYYYQKYSSQPTGRSQKNMIYYSSNPSSTNCMGWICTVSGSSPTLKQYIPIS